MGREESTQARIAWPRFLQGEDAGEIAARLTHGDPLKLGASAARRLRERRLLLDPDRVLHRALAVAARGALIDTPVLDLDAWALQKLDAAIDQLVCADREAQLSQPEILEDEEKEFALLTESLMIEPELVRACSVAFNALPELPRRAFFELMIEGREVEEVVEAGPWDEDGLYEAIHAALGALGLDALGESAEDRGDEEVT